MASIVDLARSIMAVCQPQTGTRAAGSVIVTATAPGPITLPVPAYAVPVLDGKMRPDLAVKAVAGDWEIQSTGTPVDFVSNIGGARHNFPADTRLVFDPAITGIEREAVVEEDFEDGTDPTFFGGLKTLVMYEQFSAGNVDVDLFRSGAASFPAALLVWQDSEQADANTIPQTLRSTRTGTRAVLYKEQFELIVISSRLESDHIRRSEGLQVVQDLSELLTDRQSVDDVPFSNPGGVQIRRRYRQAGPEKIYQQWYIYIIELSVEHALQQRDARTYNPWVRTLLTVDPVDNTPDQSIVDDIVIDMPQ